MFRRLLEAGPQRRDFGVDPRNRIFQRAAARDFGAVACDMSKTCRRQRAADGAGHRRESDHGRKRGDPALAEYPAAGGLRFRVSVVAVPCLVARHDQDLAGRFRRVSLCFDPGRFRLGGFGFAASALGASFALSASPCSGAVFGDSTLMDCFAGCLGRHSARLGGRASGEFGAAGPAPTTSPRLSLIRSGCCSLTSKSPAKVDHLVTFIACEFVTAARLRKF